MKVNSKEAIAWYEKHIPEAAMAAHRMMMRGDYGGEPVYFWYKPNGLSIRVARGEVKGPTGHKLVTKEHAPRNLEQAQLVRWLLARTGRLELFPKGDGTEGLSGDVTRVGKIGKAPPGPPSGFGKEKTREDYRKRIDWEGWAAAKAREDGNEAVAQGHDMARADYITNYGLKVDGGLMGLDGVGKGTRKGTRVRFNAHRGSLVLYSHHPEIGEEGTVGTMPGFGKRTYLPGPGGGLLYVDWDQSGMIGVSPNDVERVHSD